MKQLNLYWLGGGGGSSVPDGRTVTPINDVTLLQQCAGIANPTYTSLSQILADTGILQAILSNQNAVNYLVRCKKFIKKSSLIPVMTSDSTPSGQASASLTNKSQPAYKAFDGNAATYWWAYNPNSGSNAAIYLYYRFDNPIAVDSLTYTNANSMSCASFKLQASEDGSNYTDLANVTSGISDATQTLTVSVHSTQEYRYYRIAFTPKYYSNMGYYYALAAEVQFYSAEGFCDSEDAMRYIGMNNYAADTLLVDSTWCAAICNSTYFERVLNVKVPVMTSDTTPSGIASANSISPYSGGIKYAYGVFDGNDGSYVPFYGSNKYVQYTFPSEIKGACAILNIRNSFVGKVKAYINNEWVDLTENITFSQLNTNIFIPFNQCTPLITTFRFNIVTNAEENYLVNTLQFYGRKDI